MSKQFKPVDSKPNFPEIEDKIIAFWKEKEIFKKSVENRPEDDRFSFTDGPPFVSGMPHYGHLLTSIAKDVVPRYWTMKGKRVRRVFGWDCHGLPVEAKVNKKLGIKTRKQVEKELGVEKYIKECRSYVEQNISDWRWYIEKIGRWVDLDEPYYTMYPKFNESVIWAFKQMWDKGLIYKGKRVSLYSTDTLTPVSDFEVAMDPDNYQDTEDLSVYVKFKLKYHKTGLGVGVVIENEKGEILTAERNEPGRAKLVGIVGGKKDETDKDLFETVSRECLEEIGVVPENIKLVGSSVDIFEGRMFHTHHFKAELSSKTRFTTCDAMTDLKWVSKDKLPWDNMHIPTKNCLLDALKMKKFPKVEKQKPDVYLVAWTTTPWTIPANFALCVNPEFDYEVYKYNDEFVIVSKKRAEYTFGAEVLKAKKDKDNSTIEKYYEYKGKEFSGIKYEPVYDFFVDKTNENDHKIYAYTGVSNDDGTGVLHVAPAFGEEDHNLGLEHNLSSFSDIDEEGKMTVGECKGVYLRDASPLIAEDMKQKGNLLKSEMYLHRLPYYRGDNPLIYMAQEAYFLKLEGIKEKMLKLNKKVNWTPKTFGTKRFVEVIKTAPDWCVSRNRYWGTIMPLWKSEDGDELVMGSIEEMMQYTDQIIKETENNKVRYYLVKQDGTKEKMMLHRDTCDEIVLTKEGKKYYRVPEILDVWLDSGSVPFAEHHYPFENQKAFEQSFPADFIVEYTAQLRAWFNVLFRVSTILFDKEPFKNVLCHGTLAGNDGRKMSKTYGNYPDPEKLLKTTGGEAFRLYMMGMPIMSGEDSDWSDQLLQDQLKLTLIPLWNVYKYFVIYAQLHNFKTNNTEYPAKNILDRWIKSYMDNVTVEYSKAIEAYDIPATVKLIRPTIEAISTWYIRRSRDRFVNGDKDALQTLYSTIIQLIKTFAPQIVFITEEMYQNLVVGILPEAKESIHLDNYPNVNPKDIDTNLLSTMEEVKAVCSAGLKIRDKYQLRIRQPLAKVFTNIDNDELLSIIKDELNVKEVGNWEEYKTLKTKEKIEEVTENEVSVALDTNLTDDLVAEGELNDLTRAIQQLRKDSGCNVGEIVTVNLFCENKNTSQLIENNREYIEKETKVKLAFVLKEEIGDDGKKVGETVVKVIGNR